MVTFALPGQPVSASRPERSLGVDDLISVSVHGSSELTRTVRVSADGTISLPLLGSALVVTDRTPSELESELRQRLQQEGILVDPIVSITVSEYLSRPVTIVGAVRQPGSHQADTRLTLLDLLARAGGPTASADSEILITRGQSPPQRVSLPALLDGSDPAANVTLVGGETVRLPEARQIFVVGNVRRPGAFPVRIHRPLTVLQAIALAEGLTPFHRPMAYILRRDSSGTTAELPVALSQILKREVPDPILQPEDTLYIPDHPARRATVQAVDRAAGFSLATLSGLLVWRR